MIDTSKPIRFYKQAPSESERVYFYVESIQTENAHVFTCKIKGEPDNFFIINKISHTLLNPFYNGWIVENYEISNFPEPETKFINTVDFFDVDYNVLAEWQKNKPTSQIEAWAISNSPYRKIQPDVPKSFGESFKDLFVKSNKPVLKKVPQRTFEFLLEEFNNKRVLVRDFFTDVHPHSRIGRYTTSINVVSSIETHDISMPVYHVKFNTGMEMMFYNDLDKYHVSIISKEPVNIDLDILYAPSVRLFSNDCPGFRGEWIFAPYTENRKQFTSWLKNSDYDFFTFLYLLYLDIKTKQK
jgi:hypothetical protein